MNYLISCLALAAMLSGLSFSACATAPESFEYEDNRELKSGPGLFSGKDGVFTIYRRTAEPTDTPDSNSRQLNPEQSEATD